MSEELLDVEEFKERVQDDAELMAELLDIYLADYEGKRQALEEALNSGNSEEVKSVAHSLKGASGNISAKSMREHFLSIEEKAKADDLSGAKELLPALDETFEALKKRIEELKNELQ